MSTPEPTDTLSVPRLDQRLQELGSAHGSESSLHRVKNMPGYNTPVFKGKDEQRTLVENDVAAKVHGVWRLFYTSPLI